MQGTYQQEAQTTHSSGRVKLIHGQVDPGMVKARSGERFLGQTPPVKYRNPRILCCHHSRLQTDWGEFILQVPPMSKMAAAMAATGDKRMVFTLRWFFEPNSSLK